MARRADNFLMRNATGVAILSVTLLILLGAILTFRQDEARNVTKGLLVHTYEVTGHIQLLFNRLKDVELGQRGYMIAGNEEYLAPYYDALKNSLGDDARSDRLEQHHSLTEELSILRRLTQDNPVQQQNLDEMASYVKELLEYWEASIAMRHDKSAKSASTALNFHKGNQLMDHVRRLVSIMMAEENRLLAARTDADEASTQQSNLLTFSGLAVFYVIMALSIWLYQRGRQRYTRELEQNEELLKAQQEELQVSNEEMEEKTRALEEQNAQIQQQAEELTANSRLLEEKANELERSSNYKSEFLANMSHELRTPLNSLLILAKTLAANEDGNLTTEQIEEARVIHSGGLELLSLINDILDLSKVEAGKISLYPEDVAFGQILLKLEQQFAPIARQSGVVFRTLLGDDLPPLLHTDSQRVEQILKNLLSNAFKFTEKGSVTLRVRRAASDIPLNRSSLDYTSTVAFSVTDTGIGIEPSKLKDIFEAFQQEDGSVDRHYGGTGLGLTIARKFARMLGGEIHAESEKGNGSAFTLLLPLKLAHGQADAPRPSPFLSAPEPAPVHVAARPPVVEFIPDDRKMLSDKDKVLLLIEDDKEFAAILIKIAHKHGYKCLATGDGRTGLLLAAEQPVSAVILDLKLPDIDGLRVLDQLKHDLKTRHIPVHIITGRSEEENIAPLRKGAIGYLTKPVEKEALDGVFRKIEGLLQSKVKKVLVVEDDRNAQVAMGSLLKKKDVEITFCSRGDTALDQAKTGRFDCIILDLRLPDMTGFEWLELIEHDVAGKGEDESGLPPIIVYTAKELTEEENRRLSSMTSSIVIKGASSSERLLDEVTLFLHSVESTLSKDQQAIIRMQHNPDQMLQGRTVLLVDDDLRNTFALSKPLKKRGLHVVIADNGEMALEKLRQEKAIEVVIMDIMMPVMDGYQAMRKIREEKAWRDIPIIALTARAMPEEQDKCMEAGANDYLTKPVDVERLLTLMRVWLFKQELAA